MDRKEKDPLSSTMHAPHEPEGDDLPVEPEMQKSPTDDTPEKETGPDAPRS